jgi:hypothetical protein
MNLARKTWILARRNRELLGRSIGKMMIKLINHGIFANGLARSLKTTEKMQSLDPWLHNPLVSLEA